MQYKHARARTEIKTELSREMQQQGLKWSLEKLQTAVEKQAGALEERGLLIPEWNIEAIGADPDRCGLSGSPTLVMHIERPQLQATEYCEIGYTDVGLCGLIEELIADHILE